jgi:methionyl-tRNA formyltransferase
VRETGVSVAFTVRAMDAGPVLAQERVPVDDAVQAPQLLAELFQRGTSLLLSRLPDVWSGQAALSALPQVHPPINSPTAMSATLDLPCMLSWKGVGHA